MRIPTKVKVAGRTFEIIYPYVFKERTDIDGRTDFSTGKCYISGQDSAGNPHDEAYTEIIFLHELFHMIDRAYCCNNLGEQSSKEDIIEGLAQGLYEAIHGNYLGLDISEGAKPVGVNPVSIHIK